MSWMKPWEVWDELDAQMEEWAKSLPKKKKKKAPNYYELKGSCYILEYSKSSRAECKVCRHKILKNELRVGKKVQMAFTSGEFDDNVAHHMGPIWFHSSCFWGLSYRAHQHDPKRDSLQSYTGFNLISVKDQEKIHMKVTGQPMSDEMVENAVIAEATRQEEVKKNGVFVDSDPFVIAESLVEKWLFNIPKADEVKHLVKVSGLTAQKGKNKKQDLLRLLNKQKFDKIPEVLTLALTKYLTAADLKQILGPLKLKISGSKGEQVARLVCHLIENQVAQVADNVPLSSANAAIDTPTSSNAAIDTATSRNAAIDTSTSSNDDDDKENTVAVDVSIGKSKKRTTSLPNAAPGLVSPLKKLKVQSFGEALIMNHVKVYCTKYLRVQDLKSMLDELDVNRKGINKKTDLIELVTSQDVSLVRELCSDSLIDFASPEDLRLLCQQVGVEEAGTNEGTTQLILAAMQAASDM